VADERESVAERLRRIRNEVRERALLEPSATHLPEPRPVREPERVPAAAPAAAAAPPQPPDGSDVNALWQVLSVRPLNPLGRLVRRLLAPLFEAQVTFNSRQVQLDNQILAYLDARFAHTHRHYDSVLGVHGRHMADIDERHLILQEELVAHVHDLVKRIDLVLAEADKGRLSLELALRDVRARLEALEQRVRGG
jgi:hypothetical protein